MSATDKIVVGYVDEDQTAASDFSGEMPDDFEVVEIVVGNEEPLKALIERIKQADVHYLVVDYHLNQDISLDYSGDDVIAAYMAEFRDFPSMLLTSDGRGALENSEDISLNIIRDKSELTGDNGKQKELLILQITKSVEEYRRRLADAEHRYIELLDKREQTPLTHSEEKEATRLN